MIHSIRIQLILCFLIVSFLVGGTSLFVGSRLLYNTMIHENKNHNRLALNAELDFAGIVTGDGIPLCRLSPCQISNQITLPENPLVRHTIRYRFMTIGNVIGGGIFVGMSYWGAYLKSKAIDVKT